MMELSVIRDLVAIFGVIAGFSYYVLTVRNAQRTQRLQMETRQTQLFMAFVEKLSELRVQGTWREVYDEWTWTDYGDFMQRYGPDANTEGWMKFMAVAGLFEMMGVLATHGSVDVKIMYDLQGGYPIRLWDKYEDIIDAYRIEREDPPKGMFLEYFEDLVYMLRDERARDIRDLDNRLTRRRIQRQKLGKAMPDFS